MDEWSYLLQLSFLVNDVRHPPRDRHLLWYLEGQKNLNLKKEQLPAF
jgi:hypothetical protein